MRINLIFASDLIYAYGPNSTFSLPHPYIDVDVSTNPSIASSIGCSRLKKCRDISINLLS